jgi:glycosyltransferase involved in cell wall biosynthesis
MRIGLFTDTYRPSINGIVFVVESLKEHLEAQGHEVYIFCPGSSIRPGRHAETYDEDEHVIRFPSIKGAFYDDYDMSLFFPPRVLSRIKELDLDVIHFFTPSQVGMMGVYASHKCGIPLVAQHCTDLREYVEHYRDTMLLPGLLALITLLPFAMKVNGKDIRELLKMYLPRRERVQWNIDIVERVLTLIYSKCDAVIALSRKSKVQLESWQTNEDYHYDVTLMPNGVDRIKPPTEKQLDEFRAEHGIDAKDEVFGFVGRLGAEKNLAVLIETFEKVVAKRPKARLLFVGDFEYRATLEQLASETSHPERVTFTGALPRERLGVAYASMDVFTFPSLTDTQGWVLHEAALAGLPIVLIDKDVSEVVVDGESGSYAENSADSVADAVIDLLSHPKKRGEFGAESQRLARQFTEKRQVAKLAKLYEQIVTEHRDNQH